MKTDRDWSDESQELPVTTRTIRVIPPVTPLRGMYTREMKIYIHINDSYRNVHSSVIPECQKVFTIHIHQLMSG